MRKKKAIQPPELSALERAVRGDGPFDDEAAKDQVRLILFGVLEGLTRPGSRMVQVQHAERWRAVAIDMMRRGRDFSQMQPESAGRYADYIEGAEKITDCAFRDAMICVAVDQLTDKTWVFGLEPKDAHRIVREVLSELGVGMSVETFRQVVSRQRRKA